MWTWLAGQPHVCIGCKIEQDSFLILHFPECENQGLVLAGVCQDNIRSGEAQGMETAVSAPGAGSLRINCGGWKDRNFFKDFIYLFMRETERQRCAQREKQAPCGEPDVGLDPGTPGS